MIGLLTYDRPHKKTYDLACRLKTYGYETTLILTEWIDRPKRHPLVQHRPEGYAPTPRQLAASFGFYLGYYNELEFDEYIIGGANVIPGLRAINSHPGYLPVARGLDSLKWSILYGLPIGVTTHYTTDEADAGAMIKRRLVPLYYEDTFHSFAYRAYEIELDLLIQSIGCEETIEPDNFDMYGIGKVQKRMPPYLEVKMLAEFEKLRLKAKSRYEV